MAPLNDCRLLVGSDPQLQGGFLKLRTASAPPWQPVDSSPFTSLPSHYCPEGPLRSVRIDNPEVASIAALKLDQFYYWDVG